MNHRAPIAAIMLGLAALPSCGGQTDGGSNGASTSPDSGAATGEAGPSSGTETYFLALLHDGPGLCLPQTLQQDPAGQVPCWVFEVLPAGSSCSASLGLSTSDPGVAASVRQAAQAGAAATVCDLQQIPTGLGSGASCTASTSPGWCYLSGTETGDQCAQEIVFSSSGTPAAGIAAVLGCI